MCALGESSPHAELKCNQNSNTRNYTRHEKNTHHFLYLLLSPPSLSRPFPHDLTLAGCNFQVCGNSMPPVALQTWLLTQFHTLRFRFQAGSTFGVVTYTYPNVSAKVIPAFVKIVTANV